MLQIKALLLHLLILSVWFMASITNAMASNSKEDVATYLKTVESKVNRLWSPPGEMKRVVVTCKIHKEGEVSHLRIAKSSGKSKLDQAAMKAVERADSFDELPDSAGDNIDIRLTFEKKVIVETN